MQGELITLLYSNPEFSPLDISGLIHWFDANDEETITYNGSNQVTNWRDKGSSRADASKSAGADITYNTGAAVGSFTPQLKPSLYGTSASGQKMTFGMDLTTSDDYTLLAVLQSDTVNTDPTTGSSNNSFIAGSSTSTSDSYICIRSERLDPDEVRTTAIGAGFETSETGAMVFGNTWNIADGTIVTYKNGVEVDRDASLSVSTETIDDPAYIMGDSTSNRGWLGCAHEILLYKRTLSLGEIELVSNHLKTKWGL